jgi:hypothetical protein
VCAAQGDGCVLTHLPLNQEYGFDEDDSLSYCLDSRSLGLLIALAGNAGRMETEGMTAGMKRKRDFTLMIVYKQRTGTIIS